MTCNIARKWIPCVLRTCVPLALRRKYHRSKLLRANQDLIVDPNSTIVATTFGPSVVIGADAWIVNSHLDSHTYAANRTCIAHALLGKFCSIGPGAFIGLPQHPTRSYVSSHPIFYTRLPSRNLNFADKDYFEGFTQTIIGNDVWIGANALIKGGLTIGDGAIIGAGAVVTRDVPPYAIVGGIPASLLRYRFTPDVIAFMLTFRWWDKDEAWIKANFLRFHDAESFVQSLRQQGAPLDDASS